MITTPKNTMPSLAAKLRPTQATKTRNASTTIPNIRMSISRSPRIGSSKNEIKTASTAPRMYMAPAKVVPR